MPLYASAHPTAANKQNKGKTWWMPNSDFSISIKKSRLNQTAGLVSAALLKLSDNDGDEAGGQTGGLIES